MRDGLDVSIMVVVLFIPVIVVFKLLFYDYPDAPPYEPDETQLPAIDMWKLWIKKPTTTVRCPWCNSMHVSDRQGSRVCVQCGGPV